MQGKYLIVAVGVVLMVAGFYVTSIPIGVNRGNQCTVDMGCFTNGAVSVPSVGLGLLVVVVGLLVAVYGYRRGAGDE